MPDTNANTKFSPTGYRCTNCDMPIMERDNGDGTRTVQHGKKGLRVIALIVCPTYRLVDVLRQKTHHSIDIPNDLHLEA